MMEDGFIGKGELLEDQLKPKKRGRQKGYKRSPEEIAKMRKTRENNKLLKELDGGYDAHDVAKNPER